MHIAEILTSGPYAVHNLREQ